MEGQRPAAAPRGVRRILAAMRIAAGGALRRLSARMVSEEELTGTLELSIAIEADALDGGFVATCLELPGCMSQGETREEALHNAVDAIGGVLEARLEDQLRSNNGHTREVVKLYVGPNPAL